MHLRLVAKTAEFRSLDFNEQSVIFDFLDPTINFLAIMEIGESERSGETFRSE
jgi:hypothetical protein